MRIKLLILAILLPASLLGQTPTPTPIPPPVDHVFDSIPCNKRINVSALQAAVQGVAPGASLEHSNCRYITDDQTLVVTTVPQRLVVRNVPAQHTRAQVQNFLTNHNPAESDREVAIRERLEAADAKARELQVIKDVFIRLHALDGLGDTP